MNPAIALFIKDNWKLLAGVIIAIALGLWVNNYIDSVYAKGVQQGVADTTKKWQDKYNRDVDALNNKITETEKISVEQANKAKLAMETSDKRIAELQAKIAKERAKYDSLIYTSSGNVACVVPEGQSIYLGPDFSAKWNEINREILQ